MSRQDQKQMRLTFLPEFLDSLEKENDEKERVRILREYISVKKQAETLRFWLECMFHPKVEFDLPEGTPPYNPGTTKWGFAPNNLNTAMQYVKNFVRGTSTYLKNPIQRQNSFIKIAESLHAQEAVVWCEMKDKDNRRYKHATLQFFKDHLPVGATKHLEEITKWDDLTPDPIEEENTVEVPEEKPAPKKRATRKRAPAKKSTPKKTTTRKPRAKKASGDANVGA